MWGLAGKPDDSVMGDLGMTRNFTFMDIFVFLKCFQYKLEAFRRLVSKLVYCLLFILIFLRVFLIVC